MRKYGTLPGLGLGLILWLATSQSAVAVITIEGLSTEEEYSGSVTFRVVTEPGSIYTAELNGEPVALDVPVAVTEPDYYELFVLRHEEVSGAEESTLVQFVVRAPDRGSSEVGLPRSVRYPPIDSAAAEFAGANLTIITPAQYPLGLEIPVVAWVEDDGGRRVGVNGVITAPTLPDLSVRLLRGVGSGYLPAGTVPQTLAYTAEIQTLQAGKQTVLEETTAWTTVSGTLNASTDWGEDARRHVTDDLTVADGATLTIGAGSVIRLDPDVEITINGTLNVTGTREQPVVFTAEERSQPWGGFLFRTASSVGQISGAIFTGGCADPDWFDDAPDDVHTHRDEQALLYVVNDAHVTLTDCYLIDNLGQAGHGDDANLTFTRCLIQRSLLGGQYNGGVVSFRQSAVIECPAFDSPFEDDDSDALYFTEGAPSLIDCLVGWALDDGVDAGSGGGGTIEVRGCWFESCYHEGMAWSCDSGTRVVTVRDTVALNCGQGIECGWGRPEVDAERIFCTDNLVGARFGDNYDWDYNGTLNVSSSLLLFNRRDIWGRNWDDWQERLSQMDLHGNYLSEPDPLHPDNTVWDPVAHAAQLVPFLPAPATEVGVGWAIPIGRSLDQALLAEGVPVRLSTFTTVPVSVEYTVTADQEVLTQGTVQFVAGETVRFVQLDPLLMAGHTGISVRLSNPLNAEVTGSPDVFLLRRDTLIASGSVWKYSDQGIDHGTAWRTALFDDSSWPEGPAELGYGDDDEATVIEGGPSDDRRPTAYFRRRIEIVDPFLYEALEIRLRRDDGGVVYINGIEVFRSNMPDGTITYSTWADGTTSSESSYYTAETQAGVLVSGTNTVAVEVHQANSTSSDLSFDLELIATAAPSIPGYFVRGESNGDRTLDISDAIHIILVLFAGETADCEDALDVNDDGATDISDAIYHLNFLFKQGPVIPPPYPTAGEDPTGDSLGCERG